MTHEGLVLGIIGMCSDSKQYPNMKAKANWNDANDMHACFHGWLELGDLLAQIGNVHSSFKRFLYTGS